MAVPFVMPESNVDDIQDLIRVIVVILTRIRMEPQEENLEIIESMQTLISLLIDNMNRRSLYSDHIIQLSHVLHLLRHQTTSLRSSRGSSYKSCACEKFSGCSEETVCIQERTQTTRESLWQFVTRRKWWRAMPIICAIGWHLFQRSYI